MTCLWTACSCTCTVMQPASHVGGCHTASHDIHTHQHGCKNISSQSGVMNGFRIHYVIRANLLIMAVESHIVVCKHFVNLIHDPPCHGLPVTCTFSDTHMAYALAAHKLPSVGAQASPTPPSRVSSAPQPPAASNFRSCPQRLKACRGTMLQNNSLPLGPRPKLARLKSTLWPFSASIEKEKRALSTSYAVHLVPSISRK